MKDEEGIVFKGKELPNINKSKNLMKFEGFEENYCEDKKI
jgi:hypothetical protein